MYNFYHIYIYIDIDIDIEIGRFQQGTNSGSSITDRASVRT